MGMGMADTYWDTDWLDDMIGDLGNNPVTDSSHRPPGGAGSRPPRRTIPAVPCLACQKPITGELWVQPERKVDTGTVTHNGKDITVWEWEPTYFCDECAHIPVPSKHGGTRTIAGGGHGRPCEWCGRVFHARAHWRIYCTPACRQASAVRTYYETHRQVAPTSRTCEVCGRSFTARSDARTCSNACRQKAYRQRGLAGTT
jgi:hypothetical protein